MNSYVFVNVDSSVHNGFQIEIPEIESTNCPLIKSFLYFTVIEGRTVSDSHEFDAIYVLVSDPLEHSGPVYQSVDQNSYQRKNSVCKSCALIKKPKTTSVGLAKPFTLHSNVTNNALQCQNEKDGRPLSFLLNHPRCVQMSPLTFNLFLIGYISMQMFGIEFFFLC